MTSSPGSAQSQPDLDPAMPEDASKQAGSAPDLTPRPTSKAEQDEGDRSFPGGRRRCRNQCHVCGRIALQTFKLPSKRAKRMEMIRHLQLNDTEHQRLSELGMVWVCTAHIPPSSIMQVNGKDVLFDKTVLLPYKPEEDNIDPADLETLDTEVAANDCNSKRGDRPSLTDPRPDCVVCQLPMTASKRYLPQLSRERLRLLRALCVPRSQWWHLMSIHHILICSRHDHVLKHERNRVGS